MDNEHMQTLPIPAEIESIDPVETTILIPANPATFSDATLLAIRMACEPRDRPGDLFRGWLRERVVRELGRREANNDGTDGAPLEVEAWAIPWHTLDDGELSAALAATFSWTTMELSSNAEQAFREIHCAVVVACTTRLSEFHTAIENARKSRGK